MVQAAAVIVMEVMETMEAAVAEEDAVIRAEDAVIRAEEAEEEIVVEAVEVVMVEEEAVVEEEVIRLPTSYSLVICYSFYEGMEFWLLVVSIMKRLNEEWIDPVILTSDQQCIDLT